MSKKQADDLLASGIHDAGCDGTGPPCGEQSVLKLVTSGGPFEPWLNTYPTGPTSRVLPLVVERLEPVAFQALPGPQ